MANLTEKLQQIAATPGALTFRRGVEREALRVDADGNLARTPHPDFLGSKLTHPTITTDFSEAQLEFVTPVDDSIDATLDQLEEVHRFVYSGMTNEILWSASMPCVLQGDQDIPLARYGTSNLGKLKTTYRHGLGERYGRAMQTICAVHYNFSFDERLWAILAASENDGVVDKHYVSRRYFEMMRNFRRLSWLPLYLFGASPAVCNSFVRGRDHELDRFDEGSLFLEGATSLRSGSLGYQSDIQKNELRVCYNSLENYVSTLAAGIVTPHETYTRLGLVRNGKHIQVNDSIIQSEAEFYSTIRAKRVPPKGTNFLKVLRDEGVEYVEVRLLDVNPFLPLGIDAAEIRFLDMLLLHCLLTNSPEHDDATCNAVGENVQRVVRHGRSPETHLTDGDNDRSVKEWGLEVIRDIEAIATMMDQESGSRKYTQSLATQKARVEDSSQTPSASVLADMRSGSIPFFRFAMNKALAHREHFLAQPLTRDRVDYYNDLSRQSLADAQAIETADSTDFETYLAALNDEYRDLL